MFPQGFKSVGMLGNIIPVVEPFFDDDAHQAERQSRVRAGLDGDVPVGHAGGAGEVGVDDHQPGALAARFFDEGPQVNVIAVDIRGPGDDVPGMAEVFRVCAQLFPIDRYQGIAACSGADGAIELRGAEPMKEAAIHGAIAEHTHGPRVGIGQDGLRTVLLGDQPQPFRDQVQCLVPADAFEGISLAAGGHSPFGCSGSAAHGVEQPRGRIDAIQILGDLAAEKAAGHRMRRITLHPRGLPDSSIVTRTAQESGQSCEQTAWTVLDPGIAHCSRTAPVAQQRSEETGGSETRSQSVPGPKTMGRSPTKLLANRQATLALSSIHEKRPCLPIPRSCRDTRGFLASANRARGRHSSSAGPTDGRLEPGRCRSLHEGL